ncbi:MAG: hypothetical protein V4574_21710 [Pseudomonadota bacterium]
MSKPDYEILEQALSSLDRLLKMFQVERIIYLVGAGASLVLLTYAAFLMVRAGNVTPDQFALLFGSGGLFVIAGTQVTLFLRKAFDLIADLMRQLVAQRSDD